jgi:hypothetical protein
VNAAMYERSSGVEAISTFDKRVDMP